MNSTVNDLINRRSIRRYKETQISRQELDTVLRFVFGSTGELDALGVDATDEKVMLRNVIITAAHKLYLEQLFLALRENGDHTK